jgi:hypothetical protein
LRGTITPHAKQIADAGDGYSLRLVGSLKGLGATVATGAVHGTGFIARGRETLTLTLRLGRGTITVEAVSGIVPGFTHP